MNPLKAVGFQSDSCSAMLKACRLFQVHTHPDEESEDEENAFVVENNEDLDFVTRFQEFVGCGPHRLHNSIRDAVKDFEFFRQLNSVSKKTNGPRLCATRWYGVYNQLKHAVDNQALIEAHREANLRAMDELDKVANSQMKILHQKLKELGRFFECELPVPDYIVSQVRMMLKFLNCISNNDNCHQTVRNFAATLGDN